MAQGGHSRKNNDEHATSGSVDIGAALAHARNINPAAVSSISNAVEAPGRPIDSFYQREPNNPYAQALLDPDVVMIAFARKEFNIIKGQYDAAARVAFSMIINDRPCPDIKFIEWLDLDMGLQIVEMESVQKWIVKTATPMTEGKRGEQAKAAVEEANAWLERHRRGELWTLDKAQILEMFWKGCGSAEKVRKWQKAVG